MKSKNVAKRLAARQKDFDAMKQKIPPACKRPGSKNK